jgi:hypothetical protein
MTMMTMNSPLVGRGVRDFRRPRSDRFLITVTGVENARRGQIGCPVVRRNS